MKILVTGGYGMLGSAFSNLDTKHEVIRIGRQHADLTDHKSFIKVLNKFKPDSVIHLAAMVGGVKANMDNVADFYSINSRINDSVLTGCHFCGIEKVVSLLSTCIYPDKCKYPLTEEQIHNGNPHESNFGYAYAKRMLHIQSKALRKQYNRNYICAVPNNLFGLEDNFDLENSHVIPAIIRKIWEAKLTNKPPIFWGDGSPLREFTYAKDIADILIFLLEKYNSDFPINIGSTEERSIKSIVELVSKYFDYRVAMLHTLLKPRQ